MNEIKKEMALVVIGFDGYSDLWDDYFNLLNMYWGGRKYKTYLINNTKDVVYDNVKVFHAGIAAEWSKKVQLALENTSEKYICLLLEDFFTGDYVDENTIDEAIAYMEQESLLYYKLGTFTRFRTKHFHGVPYLYEIPQNMEYGISLLAGIWRRDFLQNLVGSDNYNAWNFEYDRIKEARKSSSIPFLNCVYDDRNILKIVHGVVQSKYLPSAIKYFKKKNYALNKGNREVMSQKDFCIYRLKIAVRQWIPGIIKKYLKKLCRILGIKFVSDKYER